MNAYTEITDRVLNMLSSGIIPWIQPYVGSHGARNLLSQKEYSLCNQMLLPQGGEYLTPKQALDLGGKFAGEKTSRVYFCSQVKKKVGDDEDGNPIYTEYPCYKAYNVLHLSQVEGVESRMETTVKTKSPIEEAEELAMAYLKKANLTIRALPYGSPSIVGSTINIPSAGMYNSIEAYYCDLFRQLVKSTAKELNRHGEGEKWDYASREELVGEIGAAVICNDQEIDILDVIENSTAYIARWMGVLQNDKGALLWASKKAKEAVEYIKAALVA